MGVQGIVSGTLRACYVVHDMEEPVSLSSWPIRRNQSSRSTPPLSAERVMASKARTVARISAVVTG